MTVTALEWVSGCDRVVLEPIPDLDVRFVWPHRGVRLFGLAISWDTTRTLCLHGGVFMMSHIGQGRMFLALYMQRLLLTKQTRFKTVRNHLGPKGTISTWLGAGSYKWYQNRSPTSVWGFVWPRKGCLSVWHRNPMGHNEDVVFAYGGGRGGGFVMSHIGQGRMFLALYM